MLYLDNVHVIVTLGLLSLAGWIGWFLHDPQIHRAEIRDAARFFAHLADDVLPGATKHEKLQWIECQIQSAWLEGQRTNHAIRSFVALPIAANPRLSQLGEDQPLIARKQALLFDDFSRRLP